MNISTALINRSTAAVLKFAETIIGQSFFKNFQKQLKIQVISKDRILAYKEDWQFHNVKRLPSQIQFLFLPLLLFL